MDPEPHLVGLIVCVFPEACAADCEEALALAVEEPVLRGHAVPARVDLVDEVRSMQVGDLVRV
ncbi:hypothetical protein [Streptomyces sp. NPDC005799]|uniref:hypothetical protein n=1 Tax=Streptomyces sp. NPDC005799 TaxID=3154678 RepID=UPI0033DA4753